MRVHVAATTGGTDTVRNRDTAAQTITAAARDGARLVVLPEYAARFDPRGVGPELAEPLDGPFVNLLRGLAEQTGVSVVAGTTLPGERADRAVNAVVAVDGTGGLAGVYRKVHLYDAFGHRESERLEPGPADAAPLVLDVDGLRVGVMTCYDLRFPESARRLVDAGASVLVVPAAWAAGEHKADQWLTLLRARAIEDTAYVLGSAQQGHGVVGDSVVVDPHGVVLARAGGRVTEGGSPGVAAADLDPEVVRTVRERNPSLANRRYGVVPIS
ncbi:hydrolase [Actinotalea sp. K2]|nr:hydrolase [Actinotalea sp. K2]